MANVVASRLVLQEQAFGKFQDKWIADPKAAPFFGRDPRTDTDSDWLEDLAKWSVDNFKYSQPRPEEVLQSKIKKETTLALVQNPNFPIDGELASLVFNNLEAFVRGNPALRSIASTARFWNLFGRKTITVMAQQAVAGGFLYQLFGKPVEELKFKREFESWASSSAAAIIPAWNLSPLVTSTTGVLLPRRVVVFERGPVAAYKQTDNQPIYFPSLQAYASMIHTTEKWLRKSADKR